MGCAVEVVAVLALVSTGIAIMIGALSPGEALRRVGAMLLLLLLVPMLITGLLRCVIAPMLARLRTVAQEVVILLAVIAVLALTGWLVLHRIQQRPRKTNKTIQEE